MNAASHHQSGPQGQPASPWIQVLASRSRANVRLICLPFAGGSAVAFHPWGPRLDPRIELWGIQLPGRGHRLHEPPCASIDQIVSLLADQLRDHADLPFALFGHSLGALVAFELARELRRRGGAQPVQLFVSGRVAPRELSPSPLLHRLNDADLIGALADLNGIPEVVLSDRALMATVLPAFRADFNALGRWSYRAERPLDVPIRAYGGWSDPCAPAVRLGSWRLETSGHFSLELFEGDHFYFRREPAGLLASVGQALLAAVPPWDGVGSGP
jgi:surfactin synthase thioesterase subunit